MFFVSGRSGKSSKRLHEECLLGRAAVVPESFGENATPRRMGNGDQDDALPLPSQSPS